MTTSHRCNLAKLLATLRYKQVTRNQRKHVVQIPTGTHHHLQEEAHCIGLSILLHSPQAMLASRHRHDYGSPVPFHQRLQDYGSYGTFCPLHFQRKPLSQCSLNQRKYRRRMNENTNETLCVLWGASNEHRRRMNEYESDTLCFMRSYERNSPSRDVRLFIHLSLLLFLHPYYYPFHTIHLYISIYLHIKRDWWYFLSMRLLTAGNSHLHIIINVGTSRTLFGGDCIAPSSLWHEITHHRLTHNFNIIQNNKKTTFSISNLRKQINQRRVNCLQ